MPEAHGHAGPVGRLLAGTAAALRGAAGRRDARTVFLVAAGGYLLAYLVTVGDLFLAGGGADGLTVRTVDDASIALQSVGFFRYEAIAAVDVGGLTLLLSPLNLLVAAVLAVLVGGNLALTYLGLRQPRACGLESSAGVVAGVPALLSGAACCGPTVLLLVGVQASAVLVTGFQLLVPVALVLLVGGLLAIGRQVDPALL